jgi:hypothetical protein
MKKVRVFIDYLGAGIKSVINMMGNAGRKCIVVLV